MKKGIKREPTFKIKLSTNAIMAAIAVNGPGSGPGKGIGQLNGFIFFTMTT